MTRIKEQGISILRRQPTTSSSSSSSTESTGKVTTRDFYKKREHTIAERKRRDTLRDAFHLLRDQIPNLNQSDQMAARIVILYEAVDYINKLSEDTEDLETLRRKEMAKRAKLMKQLNRLRSNN